MKKRSDNDMDQDWFNEHLKEDLKRFDVAHTPNLPERIEFEQLVNEHKRQAKGKLWRELLLFWLTACFIFGFMLWILEQSLIGFIVWQTVIAVGAIIFASMMFRKRVVRIWKN